ncbi:uncharacterized protein LOC129289609 [Prosopis cineraria]|uniref:uncharacterized protein LOC129289609 n=1 Tax=Prosopis cineraria TaxID=364024 RepID=UPI00240F3555|nr:uncharacterized protein LOC129289609 [Prosopis cineraria]
MFITSHQTTRFSIQRCGGTIGCRSWVQWARTPRRGGGRLEHGRREGAALTRIDVGGNKGFAIGADDGMLGREEMEREPKENSKVEELRDEFEAVKDEMVVLPMMKMKEHL